MAALTPALLRSRLALDYRATMRLSAPTLGGVRAFTSAAHLKAGREVSHEDGEAGRAEFFVVEYRFPILIGPKEKIGRALCAFDLLAGGNYPYTRPSAWIISRPLPWSPHVHPGSGIVCLGNGWIEARGEMLFPQLVIHVARAILNMDEKDRGADYDGYNPDAIHFWRTVLKRRPVNPDVVYPTLPGDITHGVPLAEPSFAALTGGGQFVPVPFHAGKTPLEGGFSPIERRQAKNDGDFLPLEPER